MDDRQQHYTSDSSARWRERFRDAGLETVRESPFLSRFGGGLWNAMAMHALRVVGLLKLVPDSAGPVGRTLARSLAYPLERERMREGEG